MPVARPEPSEVRVIAHVDLDCFYVQVEQRRRPELRGKPTGVVQYNPWKGGGLIAVGYEARKCGVTRNMRGDDAKKVCPEIELVQVPVAHGKADLTLYRDAGSEVVSVLTRKGTCERASIDEVYLDITEASATLSLEEPFSEEVLKSHILGHTEVAEKQTIDARNWFLKSVTDPKDRMLASGAVVVAELRMAVLTETGFTCSAGIAHNKMLAKLASGMHKPAQQTLVPSSSIPGVLATLPIKKMKQLGGKLGDALQADLQISFVGDLLQFPESRLQDLYGVNTGTWLWNVARGLSGDEVKARTLPKSHSCGKTFSGPKALKKLQDVKYWITELASELQERLDLDFQQNRRMAHLLIMHAGVHRGNRISQDQKFPSKSCALRYGKEKVAGDAFKLFERALNDYLTHLCVSPKKKGISDDWAVTSLFIGASNIWATPAGVNPITRFFPSPPRSSLHEKDNLSSPSSPSGAVGLDGPSSPFERLNNELIMESCNCTEEAGKMEMKTPDLSLETLDNKSCELVLAKPPSTWLSQGIGDGMVSNVGIEGDVVCTPTFGMFGHVNARDCPLQLSAGDHDSCHMDTLAAYSEPSNSSEAQQLVIHCSPVEQVGPQDLHGKAHHGKVVSEKANSSFSEMNVPKKAKSTSCELNVETLSAATERSANVLDRRSRPFDVMSGVLKLKDVWGRKGSGASQIGHSASSSDKAMWGYKQGEIDEAVLSELPEDIQEELCRSLGVKRPRISRKSTIGDFFKNS